MGQTSSNFSVQLLDNLTEADKEELFHPYFQDYTLFKSRKLYQKNIIRKIIILNDNTQLKNMISTFEAIEKKPFNILYPYIVSQWTGQETQSSLLSTATLRNICHQNQIAASYFPDFQKNLVDYCNFTSFMELNGKNKGKNSSKSSLRNTFSGTKKKSVNSEKRQNHDGLSETTIWFILNQISRSLQILHKKKHGHWCLMPQTIFFNEYENWFIHDSFFIFGQNYQSILQYKFKTKGMVISPEIANKLEKDIIVQQNCAFSEDVYCLGFVVLYMMGCKDQITTIEDRNKISKQISSGKVLFTNKYSDSLMKTVQSMIAIQENRRITIDRLREKLKPLETQIIVRESSDKVVNTNSTDSADHISYAKNSYGNNHANKSSNISRNINQQKYQHKYQHQRFYRNNSGNEIKTRLKTQHLVQSSQRSVQPYISNEKFKNYLNSLNQMRDHQQVEVKKWKTPTHAQHKNANFRSIVYP